MKLTEPQRHICPGCAEPVTITPGAVRWHHECSDDVIQFLCEQIDRLRTGLAETVACLEWAQQQNMPHLIRGYLFCQGETQRWLDRIDAALAKAEAMQEGGEL